MGVGDGGGDWGAGIGGRGLGVGVGVGGRRCLRGAGGGAGERRRARPVTAETRGGWCAVECTEHHGHRVTTTTAVGSARQQQRGQRERGGGGGARVAARARRVPGSGEDTSDRDRDARSCARRGGAHWGGGRRPSCVDGAYGPRLRGAAIGSPATSRRPNVGGGGLLGGICCCGSSCRSLRVDRASVGRIACAQRGVCGVQGLQF